VDDGTLAIERGFIRPEDRQRESASTHVEEGEAPCPAPSGLSDRLVEDLTAHRTAALRIMLADNPAVTHALALPLFYSGSGTCLALRAESPDLRSSADGVADSRVAQSWDEREAA
jgi:ParB family chromosome partitioning protein